MIGNLVDMLTASLAPHKATVGNPQSRSASVSPRHDIKRCREDHHRENLDPRGTENHAVGARRRYKFPWMRFSRDATCSYQFLGQYR
jgi:hypothetical protein